MMISWVAPVHPSHPYLENDPAPSFAPTICAFHLGFSLVELPVLAAGCSRSFAILGILKVNSTVPPVARVCDQEQEQGYVVVTSAACQKFTE